MADLYLDQTGQTVQGDTNPIQPITGNKKVDDYLFSLPAEQRTDALKKITAPLTGEEIGAKIKQGNGFRPTKEQFDVYNDYKNKEEKGWFEDMPNFGEGAQAVYEIAGNTVAKLIGHPLESSAQIIPSVIEGGFQNMRNYVNMVTQSQDPSSSLFKWKNALIGDKTYDAYHQFLEALDVSDHSRDLEIGKTTMIMNKDVVDHDLVQAATIIADPPFIAAEVLTGGVGGLPMKAAQMIGMGERLARGAEIASKIKAGIYGGSLKMAGVPLEFIGKTTRGTIDKVIEKGSVLAEEFTGVEARDIKTAAKVGGFGSMVSGLSWASPTSKVYLASGFVGAAGEALTATGEQIIKNGGKRGLLSFAADAIETSDAMLLKGGSGLTPQARKLLGVLNKADPMLSYAGNFMEGGAIGAAIGGGLGAATGGEEGFWSGAGSGFAMGSLGGLVGRGSKNFGSALEHERLAAQMDMLMPMKADTDPATHQAYQLVRKQAEVLGIPAHEVDRMLVALDKIAPESKFRSGGAMDNEAVIKSFGQDPKTYDGFERDTNGAYKLDKDGNKVKLRDAEGFTIPTMEQYNAAGWTIQNDINNNIKVHINTDKLTDLKTSVLHEPFHAIFRELKMRPEFQERLAETILGRYDAQGKQIKPPSIPMSEAEGFFSQYIKNAYTGAERDAKLASIRPALDEYYKTGKMTMLEADEVTPVLARLTEEFGAYYWTAFIQDKPVDYLFKGGQFGTARTLFDGVKNKWQDYMERKVGAVNGGFDFAQRTALNPAFRDAKGKRIRVSALDYMLDDLVRTKVASSKGKSFDFNALSPDGQEAYVRSSGNGIMFEPPKVQGGKYKVRTPAQQKAVRAKNAGAMHTGLEAFAASNPEALIIKDANGMPVGGLTKDADGNFVGHPPDAIIDYFIKSGHIDAVEGARIKLLRDAAMGLTDSNVFEFNQYTGDTMNIGIGQNVRVKSPLVATKDRLVILTKFEAIVGKGDYGFYAHTLDYRHLLVRQDAMWKEPKVRAAWGDDKDAFTADLFRYFKNASQPDGVRIPSAGLWTENGEYKRNVLHQVAGLETPATGTINKSLGDIKGDMFSTYRKFRTDRMTGERMSGEKIDFNGDNATDYIRYNMMPSEMAGEATPNGKIFTHPNGYKFFQVEAGFKAHKPDGTVIGTFKTLEEATAKADVIYQKENPAGKPIPSVDNIRQEPLDAPETQEQYVARKMQVELESNKDLQALAQDPNADPAVVQSSVEAIKSKLADEYNVQFKRKTFDYNEFRAKKTLELEGADWNKEKAFQARQNQPIDLWVYPKTENFKKWAGNLTQVESLSFQRQLDSGVGSEGFVTTVYKGVTNRNFDTFKDRNKTIEGVAKDSYGTPLEEKKDPNYFVSDLDAARTYATDVIGYAKKGQKQYETARRSMALSDSMADMYYVKSEKPAVLTKIKDGSEVYSDIKEFWEKQIKDEFADDYLEDDPKRYSKFAEYNFEIFKKALEKGEFLENEKIWSDAGVQNDRWLAMSKFLLEKGYDSIVVNDNTVSTKAPTIVIDQGSTNVKAASNYGEFSPNDVRYNMMPSEGEQGAKYTDSEFKHMFIGKVAEDNPDITKGISIIVSKNKTEGGSKTGDNKIKLSLIKAPSGQEIGYMNIEQFGTTSAIVEYSKILQNAQGKGLGNLLYSEAMERLRSIGVKDVSGMIIDENDRPIKIRKKVIDEQNKAIGNRYDYTTIDDIRTDKKGSSQKDITSYLDPRARYMPSEGEQVIYVPTGKNKIGDTPNVIWGGRRIETAENKNGGIKGYNIKPSAKVLNLHDFKVGKDGYIYSEINGDGMQELLYIAKKHKIDIQPWDSKEGEFLDYTLMSGDELFKFNPNKLKEREAGSKRAFGSFGGFGEELLLAVKKEGYDIIHTMTQEGEASMILNKNAVIEKKVGSSDTTRYMPAEQAQAWRDFKAEPTTEGNSIFKNAMNFMIIQANNKYKVYNPQKALLGIYTDLDGAKRRVQREEPKQR